MTWTPIAEKPPEFPCLVLDKQGFVFRVNSSAEKEYPNVTHWQPFIPPQPTLSASMQAFEEWFKSRPGAIKGLPMDAWRAACQWCAETVRELYESRMDKSDADDVWTIQDGHASEILKEAAKFIEP